MVAQGAVGQRGEAVSLAKPGTTRNWSRVLLYNVMCIHGVQLQKEEIHKLENCYCKNDEPNRAMCCGAMERSGQPGQAWYNTHLDPNVDVQSNV